MRAGRQRQRRPESGATRVYARIEARFCATNCCLWRAHSMQCQYEPQLQQQRQRNWRVVLRHPTVSKFYQIVRGLQHVLAVCLPARPLAPEVSVVFMCVTWRVHKCECSYVWPDWVMCAMWLTQSSRGFCGICMCDMTCSYVWRDWVMCATLLCSEVRRRLQYSYVWHDTFIRGAWLSHVCDMTHPQLQRCLYTLTYESHMSHHIQVMCVTWLIYNSRDVCHTLTHKSYVSRHIQLICATWLIYNSRGVCTHSHTSHIWFITRVWCVWQDSSTTPAVSVHTHIQIPPRADWDFCK